MNKKLKEISEIHKKEVEKAEKKEKFLTNARLIIFIIMCMGGFSYVFNSDPRIGYVELMLAVLLIGIIVLCEKIGKEIEHHKFYMDTVENYQKRRDDSWKKETLTYMAEENEEDFMKDLNITGKNSLMSFLDFTVSEGGRRKLEETLAESLQSEDEIYKRQKAVREIAQQPEVIIEFLYNLSLGKKKDRRVDFYQAIKIFADDTEKNHRQAGIIISGLTAAISLVTGIMSLINPIYMIAFVPAFAVRMLASYTIMIFSGKEFSAVASASRVLGSLYLVCICGGKCGFKSEINSMLENSIRNCSQEVKKIKRLSEADSFRLNFLSYIVVNSVFPFNEMILIKYRKIRQNGITHVKDGIEAIEKMEMLISLATVALVKDNIFYPEICHEEELEFTGLRHPLIREDICVPNDFKSQGKINIITGSNMSGKTSFMKTIGVNLILAGSGAPVTGEYFRAPIMKIFTSINVEDNITEGISTFYAELLRVKKVMEWGRNENSNMIFFADEIFKGTNFNDRIYGAMEIIKSLEKFRCLVFITTHDIELCDAESENVKNYHFSEKYEDNKIVFDHVIKNGKCTTSNGRYLMEKMGITASEEKM